MSFFSVSLFPVKNHHVSHNSRDYLIAGFTFVATTICLTIDGFAPKFMQYILAFFGWLFLIFFLRGECKYVRAQVIVAISFAVIGEYFASIYMQGYIYRFGNVPAYVPTGHGLVYLTAVALARSGFFQRNAQLISIFVIGFLSLWSIWGISSFAPRPDQIGVILFLVYLFYLYKGQSPMVYLGAFFITSWLEYVGTSAGTWAWASIDPASKLPQGNPPSGVSAWYCLVDAVAICFAPKLLHTYEKTVAFVRCQPRLFGK